MKNKCKDCGDREGIIDFCEGTLAYTHGFMEKICRQCYIDRIEKSLVDIKVNLKKQKKLLREERMVKLREDKK